MSQYLSSAYREQLRTACQYLLLQCEDGSVPRIREAIVVVSEIVAGLPVSRSLSAYQAAVEFQQSVKALAATFE